MISAVAAILAVGVVVVSGYIQARKRQRWLTISSFYSLSPDEFERHVGDLYSYLGYSIQYTPRTGDQGVDVIAIRGEERLAIQVKRYADKASNTAVQAVHAGRTHHRCNRSILICLGGFSQGARSLASSTNVQLVDGDEYARMVHSMSGEAQSIFAQPAPRAILYSVALVAIAAISLFIDHLHVIARARH